MVCRGRDEGDPGQEPFREHRLEGAPRAQGGGGHLARFPRPFEHHAHRGVGGLNPGAVELALEQGAKCVWLPTLDAANHARAYGGTGTYGFTDMTLSGRRRSTHPAYEVLDGAGGLRSEVEEIIAMTIDYDVILGTGHLSPGEIRQVVDRCADLGHRKLVITHPEHGAGRRRIGLRRLQARRGAPPEPVAGPLRPRGGEEVPVARGVVQPTGFFAASHRHCNFQQVSDLTHEREGGRPAWRNGHRGRKMKS